MANLSSIDNVAADKNAPGISQGHCLVARQPILKMDQRLYGYELLFRGNWDNVDADGTGATIQVLNETLNVIGLNDLLGKGRGFINFNRKLLLNRDYELLPCDKVVIELLEDVPADNDVISACKSMKSRGYMLALDDVANVDPSYRPLIEMADIVKIDYSLTNPDQRAAIKQCVADTKAVLLAEKVETYEDFNDAKQLGCTYVQGFFFCKPESITSQEIDANKQNYVRLLAEVNSAYVDFTEVENIIKQEVSLSLKLLRYLNSAFVGLGTKIDSIKQAILLLGEKPLQKWASLVAMTCLGEGKPSELVRTTLVRSRFCELIGPKLDMKEDTLDLFLVGLLSTLDAFLDRDLDEILIEMPLSPKIKTALFGGETRFGQVLAMVIACERGDSDRLNYLAGQLNISRADVLVIHLDAMVWAEQISDYT